MQRQMRIDIQLFKEVVVDFGDFFPFSARKEGRKEGRKEWERGEKKRIGIKTNIYRTMQRNIWEEGQKEGRKTRSKQWRRGKKERRNKGRKEGIKKGTDEERK